jgi:hypothetical protein
MARAVAAADVATLVTPVVASRLIATDIAAANVSTPNVSPVVRLFDPPAPIIVPLRAGRR